MARYGGTVSRAVDELVEAARLLEQHDSELRRHAVDKALADICTRAKIPLESLAEKRRRVTVVPGQATAEKVHQCAINLQMAWPDNFEIRLEDFYYYWDEYKKRPPAP